VIFSQLLLAAAHILRVNCDEIPGDRPRRSAAYEFFWIKRRF